MILNATFPIRTVSEANHVDRWQKRVSKSGKEYAVPGYIVSANRHKEQKHQAFMECRLAFKHSPLIPAYQQRVTLWLTRVASRKLDKDNLYGAFKHVTDGICEWLGIDDGSDNFTLICAQEVVKGANAVKVRISIA